MPDFPQGSPVIVPRRRPRSTKKKAARRRPLKSLNLRRAGPDQNECLTPISKPVELELGTAPPAATLFRPPTMNAAPSELLMYEYVAYRAVRLDRL